jgi:hypothetical protein
MESFFTNDCGFKQYLHLNGHPQNATNVVTPAPSVAIRFLLIPIKGADNKGIINVKSKNSFFSLFFSGINYHFNYLIVKYCGFHRFVDELNSKRIIFAEQI